MQTCIRVQSPVVTCMSGQMCGVTTCHACRCIADRHSTFPSFLFPAASRMQGRISCWPLLVLSSSLRGHDKSKCSKKTNWSIVRFFIAVLPKARAEMAASKQPKFSSVLTACQYVFRGGSHSQRGALDPERKLDAVVKRERGPLLFFASSLHHGSPSLSC